MRMRVVLVFVFAALALITKAVSVKKYLLKEVCLESYGTTLDDYFKIRDKGACSVKCAELDGCQSFLYDIKYGWCGINSGLLVNNTTSGCPYLIDYAEITTVSTLRHAPPPTHCGPVPFMHSILVDRSSGNYSVGATFPYRCTPCTYFPPATSPGVITCGTDGRWSFPSDLCVYGPDVGYLRNGQPIPAGAAGCGSVLNDTCPQDSISSGLRYFGMNGSCYCDSACCSAGDCCYDSTCISDVKEYDYEYDYYYYDEYYYY